MLTQCVYSVIIIMTVQALNKVDVTFIEEPVLRKIISKISIKYFNEELTLIIYKKNSGVALFVFKNLANTLLSHVPVHISNENYVSPEWFILMFRMGVAKARNIVIVLDEPRDIDGSLLKAREEALWDSQAKIIIIVQVFDNENEVAHYLINRMWTSAKSANILLIILRDVPKFYINYPFRIGSGVKVQEINIEVDDCFPGKIPSEFEASDLNIGTVVKEPYVLSPKGPLIYYDGVEIRLLQSLAKLYNFTLKFKESPKGENPYLIYNESKRRVGLLGLLYRHEADIACFGVGIGNDRYYAAEALFPHTEDTLVWAVPSPRKASNYDSVYIGFSKQIWIAVALSLIAVAFTFRLFFINYEGSYASTSKCLLESWSATLSLGITAPPKTNLMKLFVACLLLYGIVITSAYQSFLVTSLTARRVEKGIQTIDEAVDMGLLTHLFPSGMYMYNQSKHTMWNKILSREGHVFETNYTLILSRIAIQRNSLSMMIKNAADYVVRKRYMSTSGPLVRWLAPYFTTYPVTCYMAPGHPLVKIFNRKIRWIVEAGLPSIWVEKILSEAEDRSVFFGNSDESHKPLSYENLEVTLIMLGTGLTFSVIVFCVEFVIYKFKVTGRMTGKGE